MHAMNKRSMELYLFVAIKVARSISDEKGTIVAAVNETISIERYATYSNYKRDFVWSLLRINQAKYGLFSKVNPRVHTDTLLSIAKTFGSVQCVHKTIKFSKQFGF